jgi:hypothetical protein
LSAVVAEIIQSAGLFEELFTCMLLFELQCPAIIFFLN